MLYSKSEINKKWLLKEKEGLEALNNLEIRKNNCLVIKRFFLSPLRLFSWFKPDPKIYLIQESCYSSFIICHPKTYNKIKKYLLTKKSR